MQKKSLLGLACAFSTLLVGGVAFADGNQDVGIKVTAGGGVEDFVGHTMRHASNASGMWGIHAGIDLQKYVSVEAGYQGSASKINAPLGNAAETLMGTTIEGIARATAWPDSKFEPYAFFGAAWRHYGVSGSPTLADSGMNSTNDLFQVPVGAGLSYKMGKWVADSRFTYRPSVNQSLIKESDGNYAIMDTWSVGAGLGYKF